LTLVSSHGPSAHTEDCNMFLHSILLVFKTNQ
jgi:hypothetical protein